MIVQRRVDGDMPVWNIVCGFYYWPGRGAGFDVDIYAKRPTGDMDWFGRWLARYLDRKAGREPRR